MMLVNAQGENGVVIGQHIGVAIILWEDHRTEEWFV